MPSERHHVRAGREELVAELFVLRRDHRFETRFDRGAGEEVSQNRFVVDQQ